MSDPKHTPGPWHAPAGDPVLVLGANRQAVVDCETGSSPHLTQEERKANARLISAAPDLLHACLVVKQFLDSLEAAAEEDDPLTALRRSVHAPLQQALIPAIAKATGAAE